MKIVKLPRLKFAERQQIAALKEEGALSSLTERSRADFEALQKGHRDGLYAGIAERFRIASLIRLDVALQKDLARLVEEAGLPCKVTSGDSVWRAYMLLTVRDTKLASKYQRRVLSLWKERASHDEVERFLRENKIEKKSKKGLSLQERLLMARTAVMKGANHKIEFEFSPIPHFRMLKAKPGQHFVAHFEVNETEKGTQRIEVQFVQNVT